VGAPALVPSTLVLAGATAAMLTTAAVFSSLAGTATATLETGSELVIALDGTAVTAPDTFWLT
jgi:hypothetical protein